MGAECREGLSVRLARGAGAFPWPGRRSLHAFSFGRSIYHRALIQVRRIYARLRTVLRGAFVQLP